MDSVSWKSMQNVRMSRRGELVPFTGEVPVEIPEEAPDAGGPRPEPMTEDDLDFEDDTTLEKFVVGPTPTPSPSPAPETEAEKEGRGFRALLAAIAGSEGVDGAMPPGDKGQAPPEEGDQSMGAAEEAKGLLEYLVRNEHLELEGAQTVDGLVSGTVKILGGRGNSDAKASELGSWLLEQPSVADLFIGDEDLARSWSSGRATERTVPGKPK